MPRINRCRLGPLGIRSAISLTYNAKFGPPAAALQHCNRAAAAYVETMRAEDLLAPTPAGLYCRPGDFYIDPMRPVPRALITHAHSDHARAGHGAVLATPETLDLMRLRYGEDFAGAVQPVRYGEALRLDGVTVTLSSGRPCARLGADHGRGRRSPGGRVGRLQGRSRPDLRRLRAARLRRFHHRSDLRAAGVSPWQSGRRDRKTPALGCAVSRACASGRGLCARQGATRHRAAAHGRLRSADLSARRHGGDHPLLRAGHRFGRTAAGARSRQGRVCRRHRDLPALRR